MKKLVSLSAALLFCLVSITSVSAASLSDNAQTKAQKKVQTKVQKKERKQLESGEKKCSGPQKKVRTKY